MLEDDLPRLNMSSALTLLGDAVSRSVLEKLDGTGLRHGHGYLVQRLVLGPATATEIAEELGVTQQAVSKAVKELVALGHVELTSDADDRRRRPARLTAQGLAAVETARRARRSIDERIRNVIGDAAYRDAMVALRGALEALELTDAVSRRAVPPPTPSLG